MKKRLIFLIGIILLFLFIGILVCGAFSRNGFGYNLYYFLTYNKQYSLSNLVVSSGLYKPTVRDIYIMYDNDVSFQHIQYIINHEGIKLPFIPIEKRTKIEEIDWFINTGLDVNDYIFSLAIGSHSSRGDTLLHKAIFINRYDLLSILLDRGANPNMRQIFYLDLVEDNGKSYAQIKNEKIMPEIDISTTPKEYLEHMQKKGDGDFTKEIELFKEYEIKYNEEHPNWENEWRLEFGM